MARMPVRDFLSRIRKISGIFNSGRLYNFDNNNYVNYVEIINS